MGKGSSGIGSGGGSRATNAVAIENMNESQIDMEIRKAERKYQAAQNTIDKYIKGDDEMRKAFPLGAGGLSRSKAEKLVGQMAERDLARAKVISEAIDKRETAKARLDQLNKAKKEIHGTGMTLKEKADADIKKAAQSDRKWRTIQKGGRTNGGYKPRVIQSGDYEIHGSNGFFRVYESGKEIAATSTLTKAKAAVNMHEQRKKR